ncbi:hypothetical protein [Alteromonas macleodii]|uniref:hypothetical protein n=1 Tax=Alteromonas macleodii TaxID=28108 RepID=UPI003BF7DE2D
MEKKSLLKKLYNFPLFGSYFKFLNGFAYRGDAKYLVSLAPWENWKKRVIPSYLISIVVATLVMVFISLNGRPEGFDPGDYILGAIPDLLGFAIGVFALIFVVPRAFMREIDRLPITISSKELPFNVAYPLMGLAMTLLLCFTTELFDDKNVYTTWFETFLFIYAFEMIRDLISFIATLTRASISIQNSTETEKEGTND